MEGVERLPLFSCLDLTEGITPFCIIIIPSDCKDYNEGITPNSKWYYLLVVNLIMKVLPLRHQSKTEDDVEV